MTVGSTLFGPPSRRGAIAERQLWRVPRTGSGVRLFTVSCLPRLYDLDGQSAAICHLETLPTSPRTDCNGIHRDSFPIGFYGEIFQESKSIFRSYGEILGHVNCTYLLLFERCSTPPVLGFGRGRVFCCGYVCLPSVIGALRCPDEHVVAGCVRWRSSPVRGWWRSGSGGRVVSEADRVVAEERDGLVDRGCGFCHGPPGVFEVGHL